MQGHQSATASDFLRRSTGSRFQIRRFLVSPVLITYPTWKEMFGERPSLEQLLFEVRQFDKTQTVWFLSRLNMLLALGRFHSDNVVPIQNVMLGLLVDEELLEKLKKTFGTERIDERQPFH